MKQTIHAYFSYLQNLPVLAGNIYPNSNALKMIKKNGRFCLWGVINARALKPMLTLMAKPEFKSLLVERADILEKPLKPYVCVNWSVNERINHLQDHFALLAAFFGDSSTDILSLSHKTIFSFNDLQDNIYHLKLFAGESREGSLGLKLTNNEGEHIYSITFNLSDQGKRVMHIGALQGPKQDLNNRQEIIKLLTKATHGIRTKALMFEFTLMFARIFAVEEVRGVTNKGHIYQAWRYLVGSKGKAVTFDYDQLWLEYGGIAINKYLYSLAVEPERKDPQTLKKTKRKLYEKRYAWLAESEIVLSEKIHKLAKNDAG